LLCGFDGDLAGLITQTSNRIRGLLTHIHLAFKRVVGPHLDRPAMLNVIERLPSPAQLASLSEKHLTNWPVELAARMLPALGKLRSSKRSRNELTWYRALRPPRRLPRLGATARGIGVA
jgi:hypothetical protein